jgi:S-adenosylmethionine:tRNA ribosyltransferase-isomerase
VGLGTFLPLTEEAVKQGRLHQEFVSIQSMTWDRLQKAKREGKKIWALGTTVTRSLESAALRWNGEIQRNQLDASVATLDFTTDLFIYPGFQFKMVDVLMTNFHQPGSSLLALVMAFSGIENVRKAYQWAIERQFKLFSYGDFSVWKK